jgi:hypothetical protein
LVAVVAAWALSSSTASAFEGGGYQTAGGGSTHETLPLVEILQYAAQVPHAVQVLLIDLPLLLYRVKHDTKAKNEN